MHLQSWRTKLVQGFKEGLIPIFTQSWKKHIYPIFLYTSRKSICLIKYYLIYRFIYFHAAHIVDRLYNVLVDCLFNKKNDSTNCPLSVWTTIAQMVAWFKKVRTSWSWTHSLRKDFCFICVVQHISLIWLWNKG